MKTLEDLKKLRERLQADAQIRHADGIKIIVGMGTCGIAAGAREVMSAVLDEVTKRQLNNVTVHQTGCIGMCEKEVLVDIVRPGEPRQLQSATVDYGPGRTVPQQHWQDRSS